MYLEGEVKTANRYRIITAASKIDDGILDYVDEDSDDMTSWRKLLAKELG